MQSHFEFLVHLLAAHPQWAAAIVFFVALAESLLVANLLFPGTAFLMAAGVLVATGDLPAIPSVLGTALGAMAGDGLSYWLGRRFKAAVRRSWLSGMDADLTSAAVRFFHRHGVAAVFLGRFFGPTRGLMSATAGLLDMTPARFWAANVASAVLWAPAVLFAGMAVGAVLGR